MWDACAQYVGSHLIEEIGVVAHEGSGNLHPAHRKCAREWALIQLNCVVNCGVIIDRRSVLSEADLAKIRRVYYAKAVRGILEGVVIGVVLGCVSLLAGKSANTGVVTAGFVAGVFVGVGTVAVSTDARFVDRALAGALICTSLAVCALAVTYLTNH